jgi:hypothetical protein
MRILLAAALLLPTPALADITARYTVGNDVIVIEIDDNGDYRAALEGKATIFHRGGKDYLGLQDKPGGEMMITELAAFLKLTTDAASRPPSTEKAPVFTLSQGEAAEVGGRKGVRWSMTIDRPGEKALTAVMSADAQLAPIGTVFRRTIDTTAQFFTATVGNTGNFETTAKALFAKGTPIELAGPITVTLASVDTKEIDAKRFELPGEVVDAETLAAALSASRRGPDAEADSAVEPLP